MILHYAHLCAVAGGVGYLRRAFPEDASSARHAGVLEELLDHLGLERIAVAGR